MPPQIEDIEASFICFAEEVLGLELYEWQCEALAPFDDASHHMVQVSLATPNGSGKSAVVITALVLGWLAMYPQGRVVLTTADGKQLDGQVMPALNSHRAKFPSWKFIEREIKTPGPDGTYGDGGFFYAFTTDQAGRAEGWHKLDNTNGPLLMIVDEAKTVPEDIFTAIDRCTYNAILLASSPGKMAGTFFRSQFEPELGYNSLAIGLKDCPHITQDKIDRIIAKHGPNSPFTRSALHGEFLEWFDGKPVYYAYSKEAHEKEKLGWINGGMLVVGMDVGTHNASVIACVSGDKAGRVHIWILREIILEGSDTDRQCLALLKCLEEEFPWWNKGGQLCPQALFFCDPAARNSAFTSRGPTSSALAVIQSHGIYPGMKHPLHLQPSIAAVNRLMQQSFEIERHAANGGIEKVAVQQFQIDKNRCPELVRGLSGKYRYPGVDDAGYGSDLPLKGVLCDGIDHVCFVAGTLVLTLRGEIPIERVEVGEVVFTSSGFKKVSSIMTRNAEVKSYSFSNGQSVTCTPDHPFWNEKKQRMVAIDQWTHCDMLTPCQPIQKLLSIAGGFIAGILIRQEGQIASILREAANTFITKFGKIITACAKREITSITKMEIPETMPSIISKCSPQRSTSEDTSRQGFVQNPQKGAPKSALSPRLGTLRRRATLGTSNTHWTVDLVKSPNLKDVAINAELNTNSPEQPELRRLQDSVQTIASRRFAVRAVWIMWSAIARAVVLCSRAIATTKPPIVLSGAPLDRGRQSVYNITVDGDHQYYANGLLVSNCDSFRYLCCNVIAIAEEAHSPGRTARRENITQAEPTRII